MNYKQVCSYYEHICNIRMKTRMGSLLSPDAPLLAAARAFTLSRGCTRYPLPPTGGGENRGNGPIWRQNGPHLGGVGGYRALGLVPPRACAGSTRAQRRISALTKTHMDSLKGHYHFKNDS